MNLGKRYIMSIDLIELLPMDEPAGTQCWCEEDEVMYYFDGVQWLPFGGGGGDSIWIRSGNNTYMNTPESWEVEIGGITYLWGNTTELQINNGLSVTGYINTQSIYRMQDEEVMRYDFNFGDPDVLAISTRDNPDTLKIVDGVGLFNGSIGVGGTLPLESWRTEVQIDNQDEFGVSALTLLNGGVEQLAITADAGAQVRFVAGEDYGSAFEMNNSGLFINWAGSKHQWYCFGDQRMELEQDGGLLVGNGTVTGGSQGDGTINVTGGYYVNGTPVVLQAALQTALDRLEALETAAAANGWTL